MTTVRAGLQERPTAPAAEPAGSLAWAHLLAREVAAGLVSGLDDRAGTALAVDDVTVRVGAGGPPESWAATVTLAPGCWQDDPGSPDGPAAALPRVGPPPGVARLPTRAVHGLGASWQRRLAGIGVTTVAELAALDRDALASLGGGRRQVAALVARARLLAGATLAAQPPVPAGLTVGDVVAGSAAALARTHGVSHRVAARWWAAAGIVVAALDRDASDRLRLAALVG